MKALVQIVFFLLTMAGMHQLSAQADYQKMIAEGGHTLEAIQLEAAKHFDIVGRGRGTGFKQWKRWEHRAYNRLNPDGVVRTEAEELKRWENFLHEMNTQAAGQRISTCESDWESIGPTEVVITSGYNPGIGRVTSLAVHPDDEQTIIIGAHTGGVWKTTDGAQTWTPLSEEFVNLSVLSLEVALSEPDYYYWGGTGTELYRSFDAGSTWVPYQTPLTSGIHFILVDPDDSETIWVAGEYGGLFLTEDGGDTWVSVENGNNINAYDIEFHPTVDSIVYASGYGFYKSTDFGRSFEKMAFPRDFEITMMATTAADPDRIYFVTSPSGGMGGIFVSQDQGETIEMKDQQGLNYLGYSIDGLGIGGQAPRDMDIVASQTDSNQVFVSGINIWRSNNGANSFDILSHWFLDNPDFFQYGYSHADIDITKVINGKMYIGSDGGIYRMEDLYAQPFADPIEDLSEGLNIHQIYRMDVGQTDLREVVTVGSQDNGSSAYVDGEWRNYFGADGMDNAVIDNGSNTIFGMFQFGQLFRSDDLGQTLRDINRFGLEDALAEGGRWVTPLTKSGDQSILVGYDRVYRSDDLGETFVPISQFFGFTNTMIEIEVSKSDNNVIYCTNDIGLFKTVDGGLTDWELVNTPALIETREVAVHPLDSDLIAISGGGSSFVYISRNGGLSWATFPGLPNLNASSLVWQEDESNTLYAGLTYGLFKISLEEESPIWSLYNTNLPNAEVSDLKINEATGMLYASTYGRGMWKSPVCRIETSSEEVVEGPSFSIAPNPVDDGFIVRGPSNTSGSLRLYNNLGQVVYRNVDMPEMSDHYVQTSHLSTGNYYLRISTKEAYEVLPVVIQH